jgi:hypothetical protein
MNKLGVYDLFGENNEARKDFYNWCKNNDEFCEYDLEHLEIELYMPAMDNTEKYFHFHRGNILDWLESEGYYIGTPLRGEFKFVTVCHFNSKGNVSQKPLYSNSGVKSRTRALELGVIKCIDNFEKSKIK